MIDYHALCLKSSIILGDSDQKIIELHPNVLVQR